MNERHELTERNFLRIYRINWGISGPLLFLFAWPYVIAGGILGVADLLTFTGALFFAVPFTLTVIHGHIAMALGSLHREVFYAWQRKKGVVFRTLFHPVLFTTRLRLSLLALSFIFLVAGMA